MRQGEDIPGSVGRIRVMIVDDHPIVRDGLRHIIEAEPDMDVCGEAKSAEAALKSIPGSSPDLMLVDLGLPGMDGISLIRRLKKENPRVLTIVVSMLDQAGYAERALKAGASGFVTKADATEEVVAAIRRVARGELYVSEGLAMDIIGDLVGGGKRTLGEVESQLSDREFEVFSLIGRGFRARQIAETLDLSVKTIETHQANIKRKLELRDAQELAYFARRWHELERGDGGGGLPL
jgi:DNA-binding NarL/FixJ family response regulator